MDFRGRGILQQLPLIYGKWRLFSEAVSENYQNFELCRLFYCHSHPAQMLTLSFFIVLKKRISVEKL
uniref:Ovule protein n=1 Tax=Romanomermis culicivorax TaxID=13658 RepID=A0A915KYY6_ROMCU